jgi:serine/threonine protein kinase
MTNESGEQENLRRELKALDKEGLDFIKQLLSPDPQRRPTAEQALAHPFLSLSEFLPSRSIASSGLEPNRELISLFLSWESQNQLSPTRKRLRVDAWATLVDYIIEIVHVFDLKVSAAFRAMDYFDRFFSSSSGLVSSLKSWHLFCVHLRFRTSNLTVNH